MKESPKEIFHTFVPLTFPHEHLQKRIFSFVSLNEPPWLGGRSFFSVGSKAHCATVIPPPFNCGYPNFEYHSQTLAVGRTCPYPWTRQFGHKFELSELNVWGKVKCIRCIQHTCFEIKISEIRSKRFRYGKTGPSLLFLGQYFPHLPLFLFLRYLFPYLRKFTMIGMYVEFSLVPQFTKLSICPYIFDCIFEGHQ